MAKSTTTTRKTKTAKSTKSAPVSSNRNLLIVSLVAYVGLAAAAIVLMQPVSYSVTLTHLTNDALLSQNSTAFISASKPLADLELRWLLVALLTVSAVTPLLYLTKLKAYYAERVAKRRMLEARWWDLAVSSVVIVETLALLVGYHDLKTLKLMGALLITTCLLSCLAESQNEKATKPVWSAFQLGLFTGIMPWVAIISAMLATLFYGDVRSPWYVYAATGTVAIGFSLIGLNLLKQIKRVKSFKDYAVVERNYLSISLAARVVFVGVLIWGLMK